MLNRIVVWPTSRSTLTYHIYDNQSLFLSNRLPTPALRIPVNIAGRRRIEALFYEKENITATVEGFANFFEIDEVRAAMLLTCNIIIYFTTTTTIIGYYYMA